MGRTEMEDALKKLDNLRQEEALMATAQNLKLTHDVDERTKGVVNTVEAIDKKVVGVDERVAGVNDRVASVNERVIAVVDQVKRLSSNLFCANYGALNVPLGNQLRENTHKWLSPPDPSTNHNIACSTHHMKTATWFFESRTYQDWKSTGSLLWIHGKRLYRLLSDLIRVF